MSDEEVRPRITTRKELRQWFARFARKNRFALLRWMLAMVLVGASGGIVAYVISPVGTLMDLVAHAFVGIAFLAFIGAGIYTLVVAACMLGPKRNLGWEGVPPAILKLGIASICIFLLVFIIGFITAVVIGPK